MTKTQRPSTARPFTDALAVLAVLFVLAVVALAIAGSMQTGMNPAEFAWESVAMVIRGTWDALVSMIASLFA